MEKSPLYVRQAAKKIDAAVPAERKLSREGETAVKRFQILVLAIAMLLTSGAGGAAAETGRKPLQEVFHQTVILACDYRGKVFANGVLVDVHGDYRLWQKDGRIFVPVRFMAYLAEKLEGVHSYWEVGWEPSRPEEVTLVSYGPFGQGTTVELRINSDVLLVNGERETMDVPAQRIDGEVVVPLRALGEALGYEVAWLDGLVIMSKEPIDLAGSGSGEIAGKIKQKLLDDREPVMRDTAVTPLMRYGDTVYFLREEYASEYTAGLYKKEGDQAAVPIDLPGEEILTQRRVVNGELYYVTRTDGGHELHKYNPASGQGEKVCPLGDWSASDGWLADIRWAGDELYIILHYGDLTMGAETLYRVSHGQLEKVVTIKSMGAYHLEDQVLYYVEDRFMIFSDNLFKLDLTTGQKERLGEEGYTYGVYRHPYGGGIQYRFSGTGFFFRNGSIYTLGYLENDPEALPAVYRIGADGGSSTRLTAPARAFWLEGDKLYYIDPSTGYLWQADLDGSHAEVLVPRPVDQVKFCQGDVYYLAVVSGEDEPSLGYLYKYDLAAGREIRLSETLVSRYEVGPPGVFYQGEGYDAGLYKIEPGGEAVRVTGDAIAFMLPVEEGLVYTLRYEEGIYLAR